jgi:nucleotide-binding universal stress UspA family protein
MNLLVALDAGPEGEELLVSARALSHVSGWPVRVLHVRSSADAPGLELPARLATNTAIQEEVGDPVETILATAHDDDVIAFAMRRGGRRPARPRAADPAGHATRHAADLVAAPHRRAPRRQPVELRGDARDRRRVLRPRP